MKATFAVTASLVLAGCGACEPDRSTSAEASVASSSAPASATPPPVVSHTPHLPTTPPTPHLACRAIAVDGDVHVENPAAAPDAGTTPVLLQGLVPTEAWVDLSKGARLVAKDPRTTRETTFRGAGRARACVGFAEESWVASGLFESSVGSGESPGAEEWVVTPFGVVRYGAAKLSIDVRPHDAAVTVDGGTAFAWAPVPPAARPDAGALEEGWARLNPGKSTLPGGTEGAADGAKRALDRCTTLATSARTLATQVLAPGADAGTIAAQVTTRRLARAACAVASLRVSALADADAAPLRRPLADAVAAWSTLPVGGAASATP